MRSKSFFVFFVLLFTLGVGMAAADEWTQKTPSIAPNARSSHAMASIAPDRAVLFGGPLLVSISTPLVPIDAQQTYIYNAVSDTWTGASPLSWPSARRYHAMAYIGEDKVLLFGGNTGPSTLNDTWVYDLSENTWTQMAPAASPSARNGHAMAYIGGDQVLLFGGINATFFGDTWLYDLSDNTWSQKTPITTPSARTASAVAYIGDDRVVLFGGATSGTENDETWIYDLSENTWTNQTPSVSPSARSGGRMASIEGDQLLLYGGGGNFTVFGDTWVYDVSDNTWTERTFAPAPAARTAHAMASVGNGKVLLFGGTPSGGGASLADTWVYDSTAVSALHADIDIKFCGDPNSFSCKQKGSISVTIFGSSDIDVAEINISTVKLCLSTDPDTCESAFDAGFPQDRGNPSTDLGTSVCLGGIANPDGLSDLDVLFISQEVSSLIECTSLGKKGVSETLIIKGELNDGTAFISNEVNDVGIDRLRVVSK